ncbi:MAG: hypothetical protein CMM50_17820 [Rhodospirillaceae bacterium]|nr:hypothetical protein [Rhodospirillaceae bacterium]
MSDRLSIAIANPFCWPQVRRGSERLLNDLSHYVAEAGHATTVLTTTPDGRFEVEDGIQVLGFRQRLTPNIRSRLNVGHLFALQCRRALLASDVDVVHCLSHYDAFGAILARNAIEPARRPKVLFQFVGWPVRTLFLTRPLDMFMFRYAVAHADEVAVLSEGCREEMEKNFGRRACVLPPPVQTGNFRKDPKAPFERPRLLFAGDLMEGRKGAALLARAFADLKVQIPDAVLQFVGNGADESNRAALLGDLPQSVQKDVELLGVGSLDGLVDRYHEASVMVLPALHEAFGLVLVEALASGTPVVGACDGGIRDVITDPAVGVMFDPQASRGAARNAEGLVQALRKGVELAQDPATEERCRTHAELFSWQKLGPAYLATYGRLAGSGGSPRKKTQHREDNPFVTVVVPTFKRHEQVLQLLESLMDQDYPAERYEVIVVHNDHDERKAVMIREFAASARIPIHYVQKSYAGPGASRNLGARMAKGEVLAFIDDDCRASPGWISKGAKALTAGAALVQGMTLPGSKASGGPFDRTIMVSGPSHYFETCNIFYDRKAFEAVGGFSPEFEDRFFGEDTDLGWKIKRAGYRVAFRSDALVYHEVSRSRLCPWIFEPWRLKVWPALTEKFPPIRNTYFLRFFFSPMTFLFDVFFVSAVLGVAISEAWLVLGLPYVAGRYISASRDAGWMDKLAYTVIGLPRALVAFGALLYGSVRARTVVL